ncbi:hypothetical protein [Autumnicola musiva]|uniref:Uncharacterized protein n=1 Tax=Autumnicola musiva TaxID=3075589 RepID=A0ABU3D6D4_9FLAO|nr:hypothetical protein [Zunongwangia sp. F117]MDT0677064.1 hypothetical protein [Zunongwangia sp. F117]
MSQRKYWRSVIVLGLVFAVIYTLISIIFEYGNFAFEQYYKDHIANNTVKYVIGQIGAALFYGLIVSYGQFRAKEKREKNSN